MTYDVSVPARLSNQHSMTELKDAYLAARAVRQIISPRDFKYDPKKPHIILQALRIILMARVAQKTFEHIYTSAGQNVSEHAFEACQVYSTQLKPYPDPLTLLEDPFERVSGAIPPSIRDESGAEYSVILTGRDQPLKESVAIASAHTLIEFIFHWCINQIGPDKAKNYQRMYRFGPANFRTTCSASEVRQKLADHLFSLGIHAEFLHPLLYFVVKESLIETELPFNIVIPF